MKLLSLSSMLGKLSFRDKSIFLLALWLLATGPANAQTGWGSKNFRILGERLSEARARQSLERLENLRAMLAAVRGPAWVAVSPLPVWLPANEDEWRRLADRPTEQGVFLSGSRRDWIVVNPATPNFLEVLSHEYVHAVLHRAAPNLPTWFEEGVCEYYSTLRLKSKGPVWELVIGEAPGNRRQLVAGLTEISTASLVKRNLDQMGYAQAWAVAAQLMPSYREGMDIPQLVPLRGFPVRNLAWNGEPERVEVKAMTGEELRGFWADLQARLPRVFGKVDGSQELFLRGLRFVDEGKLAEGILALEEACFRRGDQSTWWQALGLAYQEAGRKADARLAAEKALNAALNETERQGALALLESLKP